MFSSPFAPADAHSSRWARLAPRCSLEVLVALVSIHFAVFANGPFWDQALKGRDWSTSETWRFAGLVFAALVGLHLAMMLLVVTRRTARWTLTLLLLATAVATYFTSTYHVYLDPNMIRNMLHSEPKEAADLLGRGLLLQVLGQAGPAIALVWWARLPRAPIGAAAVQRIAAFSVAAAITAAAVLIGYQGFAGLFRNNHTARYLVTPASFIYSIGRAATAAKQQTARGAIGTDATLASNWQDRRRPVLLVIVVGETVRSANWGLNGYARQTTPRLAGLDVVNFRQVTACGTDTETSLPCLFAPVGRRNYDERRIRGSESLLHVLARAGFDVSWRDNQTGCKGVCSDLPYEQIDSGAMSDCQPGRCLDEHLLDGLDQRVAPAGSAAGQVLVLHTIGNHGPAYFARYPEADRVYVPTCDTSELSTCSVEAIVNSYDNAVRYTDRFLAMTIEFLGRHAATHDTALLYVSDHGESLGEHGLFLHGLPYAIAPDVQTHVPMVMWLSDGFRSSRGIDESCLRTRAERPATHDNVFHTVLGLLDVETSVRERSLDMTDDCRLDRAAQDDRPSPAAWRADPDLLDSAGADPARLEQTRLTRFPATLVRCDPEAVTREPSGVVVVNRRGATP